MIKFSTKKVKPFGDEREIDAFVIEAPFHDLNIIKIFSNLEDIECFIEWLEKDIIKKNIPDFSFENGIEFQPILFGSQKSKIAKLENGKYIDGQEFDTKDFLKVCLAWRDFLRDFRE